MAERVTEATSPFGPQPAPRIRTLAELPEYLAREFPREVLVRRCREHGSEDYSTEAFLGRITDLALGLLTLGLQPGDRVGIMSPSRPEWTMVDLAVLSAGGVSVPLYPTLAPAQARYILEESGARFVFVADATLAAKLQEVRHVLPLVEAIFVFDAAAPAAAGSVHPWTTLITRGREALAATPSLAAELGRRVSSVNPGDLATLIYTSGTTGEPKGVMLSHQNLLSNVAALEAIVGIGPADTALSYLPLSHSFERLFVYEYLYAGVTLVFAESMDTLARDLPRTRPTMMTGVPRVFEKLHARVVETAAASSPLRQRLFAWALRVGDAMAQRRRERRAPSPWLRVRHAVADRLVFSKVRARTGGRLRLVMSGSAPLSTSVGGFFEAIGMPICEGYGLTETSPVLSANTPDAPRLGTVGRAIPGVTLRIAEDGEILARGPNVMLGYYKKSQATAEVLRDGWFYTGDVGELSADGYLTITDRKKDLIVTSGGKNVAPQPVEELLKRHPLVAEAVLLGDRRQFISALIVPNFAALEPRLRALGAPATSREEMCGRAEAQALYQEIVDGINNELAHYERIRRFALLPAEFSIASGELTPTLKVRRSIIANRWQNVIDALYKGGAPGTPPAAPA